MRENEFEKQVQQKMEELKIRPSDEVWMDVERRIRKEKKRRFIFWLPLLFLLLAGGIGTAIWLGQKKEKGIADIVTAGNKNTKTVETGNKKTGGITTSGTAIKDTDTKGATGVPASAAPGTDAKNEMTKINSEKKENILLAGTQQITSKVPIVKKKKGNQPAKQSVTTAVVKENDDNPEQITVDAGAPKIIAKPGVIIDTDAGTVPAQDISINDQPKNVKQPEPPAMDSVVSKSENNKSIKDSRKWEWSLSLGAGSSVTGNGFSFGGQKSMSADALGGGAGAGPQPNPFVTASPVYRGFSMTTGVFGKKAVSKKLQVIFGAAYSYLSTRMNVGNAVDSVRTINNLYSNGLGVNNFYRPTDSVTANRYRNQYHFAVLSAELSWQIINGKKVKVYWKNGLQYGQLLGSSMLHFDGGLSGYY
ncbi:MAG: hypothetical protein ABL876_15510, partial [Chitinophagaceae bacterium]